MRLQRLTVRYISLITLGPPTWAWEPRSDDVQAVNVLERANLGGHKQLCVPLVPKHTYWYLSGVPELLELVAERIDAIAEAGQ